MEELGYLVDEVEDMDPQIAAVVIEKSLPRPRAGLSVTFYFLTGGHEASKSKGDWNLDIWRGGG